MRSVGGSPASSSLRAALIFTAVCALAGCRAPGTPLSASQLAELQRGDGFASGEIVDLREHVLVDNKDFTYSVAFSRDSQKLAYSHLASKVYQVGVWSLLPTPLLQTNFATNPNEFDAESVDFSPSGQVVVSAARDGVIRFWDSQNGSSLGAYPTEEPLVAVAFHPNGRYVVAGSAKGLVTVVRFPDLAFVSEQRAHETEVRAFAFTDGGRLFSGGWDKALIAFDAVEEQVSVKQARVRFERRGLFAVIRGALDGKASGAFGLDARSPYTLISAQLAKTAGIDVPFLKETATLQTPAGNQLVRLSRGRTLQFKSLSLRNVDVAVCDACLPADMHGVLGAPFSDAVDVAFDESAQEAQLTLKTETAEQVQQLSLKQGARFWMPWPINDLSIDRAGKRLGIAFSEVPAQRTRDIYEREKKKIEEPVAEGNAAAIVDAETGTILKKWTKHNGVVSTVGISPDGTRLVSGGWDKRLFILQQGELSPKIRREFGWSVRRVRFSRDGHFVAVAAWTPQNPLGDQTSDPAAVVYEVMYRGVELKPGPSRAALRSRRTSP